MKNGKNDDPRFDGTIEDRLWEPVQHCSADVFVNDRRERGIPSNSCHRFVDAEEKVCAQARPLPLVPSQRFGQIRFRLWSDQKC
ncbi:MAG TPA: hypothetical protein VIK18_25625 [Pirellulales bacterium]